jgi:hypothetical protein
VQFEALIEFLRRDDPRHAGSAVSMERLRERMLLLLLVLSSIADRLSALRSGQALPEGCRRWSMTSTTGWMGRPTPASTPACARASAR